MSDTSGKWLKLKDYLSATGEGEEDVRERISSGSLLAKTAVGEEYVWVEGEAAAASESAPGRPLELKEKGDSRAGEVVEGEHLVSRLSDAQQLAMQTERALSLVDRSLGAFMMMHQEVVEAKDRVADELRENFRDHASKLAEKDVRIEELEQSLKEREQELADLKMLVEILEGRPGRETAPEEQKLYSDKASVGDLMEDQLRYIMEDQMIKELLKE